jgi:hypothetical protein
MAAAAATAAAAAAATGAACLLGAAAVALCSCSRDWRRAAPWGMLCGCVAARRVHVLCYACSVAQKRSVSASPAARLFHHGGKVKHPLRGRRVRSPCLPFLRCAAVSYGVGEQQPRQSTAWDLLSRSGSCGRRPVLLADACVVCVPGSTAAVPLVAAAGTAVLPSRFARCVQGSAGAPVHGLPSSVCV